MVITNEEIEAEMSQVGCYNLNPAVTTKLIDLCFFLGKDAEGIANEWCAFAHTKQYDLVPTLDNLDEFERELSNKKSLSRSNIKALKPKIMVPPVYNSTTLDTSNLLDTYMSGTPKRKVPEKFPPSTPENKSFNNNSLEKSPFSPILSSQSPLGIRGCSFSARYKQRGSKGDILCHLGNAIEKSSWKNDIKHNDVEVSHYSKEHSLQGKFSHMYSKHRDRCFILNDVIEEWEDILIQEKNTLGIEIEEFDHVRLPNPNEKHVVGRIFVDGDGKLNSASIYLEGSHKSSSGQTISLNVDSLLLYEFFPGQIIAGSGLNTTGMQLFLKKLYPLNYPSLPVKTPKIICNLDIVAACGPFTTTDSTAYEPLTDLVTYIKTHNPHLCILIGPFVDVKVENIMASFVKETAEELFEKQLNVIGDFLEADGNCQTKFVLVPSQRDLFHDCVYPTPPYSPKLKAEHKNRFLFYSDPCIIDINGVILGVTSSDILFHLAKEELSLGSNLNKMNRLLHFLLSQRSFYPLYPPNIDVCLDLDEFEKCGKLLVQPHILITPSDLRCFVKNIQGCCCVNPERLSKGMVGGTFARIRINNVEDYKYTSFIDYMNVEVLRI